VHHQWALPAAVVHEMLSRSGPKRGAASCFNEYVPSYDHDWMDARFDVAGHSVGYRGSNEAQLNKYDDPNF
jgi:hypothetical protein